MFYEGDLQSGIGKAVEERKLVACLVTDEGQESLMWENGFLEDPTLKVALSNQTILLRLRADSQEANYLAAIFPCPKTPTFVVIHNGQLKEYLTAGISKEEFLRRMRTVLQSSEGSTPIQPEPQAGPISVQQMQTSLEAPTAGVQTEAAASTPQPPTGLSTEPAAESEGAGSSEVQNLLKERGARLEAHKKEQDAKEKADRAAKAKARREAVEDTAGPAGSKKSADMKYALIQKKRQQEAREERARILKRVEDDKAERREREALRKAQAKGKESAVDQGQSSILKPPSSNSSSVECALQIRLFDGSTIRSRFPSSGCLRTDVRPWIDKQQESLDVPYTFKHIITPLPNKNISISDEEQSLQSLELAPSATLILVPVKGYTSAYEASDAGIVSRGLSAGFGLVSSGVGVVTGAFGSLLGGGAAPATPATRSEERQDNPTPSTASVINVRTLRDQERRPEDHQLYNGNALNFEPRRDEDDRKTD